MKWTPRILPIAIRVYLIGSYAFLIETAPSDQLDGYKAYRLASEVGSDDGNT